MRIGVSTLGADAGRSGIGRYVVHLLEEWGRLPERPEKLDVLVTDGEREAFPADWATQIRVPAAARNPLLGLLWHQTGLRRSCRRRRMDALFLPAANRRGMAFPSVPTVGTVHDFSSIHVPGKYDPARALYITRVLPALVRRLDHVITPSRASMNDVVEFAGVDPARVSVVPNGVDHSRYRPVDREAAAERVRASLGIEAPYLLYVSRLEHPGKNHVRLIQAFDQLRRMLKIPHRLVLAGSDWTRASEIHRAAAESPSREAIDLLGFVPHDVLPDLNAAAEVVVFPSLYEGFGIPVLEAMACGTPVVASDTSSIPEVGGAAAIYFDPLEVDAIAEAIVRVILDPDLRASMARKGLVWSHRFSWARTARETLSVIVNQVELNRS
jgi:glycosyltransferase involved in cell wall biosynthesis